MSASVLVAYATRSGSTREVAESVADTLREGGIGVSIQPLREAKKIDEFSAVVIGAPLYMFHWHKDALRFLSRQRDALNQRPVAIFALGPIQPEKKQFEDARTQLNQELAKYPCLEPIAVEIFGGRFEPTSLRFPYNLIPALKNMPASDLRDWSAIRAWANELTELLVTLAT
jgi:menaquinone-dependent protoporphyrinogen oxidase